MKTAVLVLGPESSGTRMMTEAFIRLGFFGDAGHEQSLDNLDFSATPARIVLRRSLPHNNIWPPLQDICRALRQGGYRNIIPVLIVRDKEITIQSQCSPKNGHVATERAARTRIEYAVPYAYTELAAADLVPVVVNFEPFIQYPGVRKLFFRNLGLDEPHMTFRDANRKYRSAAAPRKKSRPRPGRG
jgi:hypothetical protein